MTEATKEGLLLRVNGVPKRVPEGETVAGLLARLGLDGRLVVVERNREILRRDEHDRVRLRDGDRLEVVHFVGGG